MAPPAEASRPGSGVAEGSERCFSCDTRTSMVWRIGRASMQLLCNRCYLHKPDLTESGYPLRIRVECSPVERVNGIYSRAADLKNGKPYYSKEASSRVTQLFLDSKEWKFGNVSKAGFYAKVKADKGQPLPTEPYPFAWKCLSLTEDGSTETKVSPAMRVLDLDLELRLPAEAHLPAQPAEKGMSLLLDSHAAPHSHKRRRTSEVPPGGSVAAERTKGGEPADGDAKREESTQDESGSESDSRSSSSSSGSARSSGTAPSPKANAMTVREVEVRKEANEKRTGAFQEKLRGALSKASAKECRKRLRQIAMNPQQYAQVSSMAHDDLMAFCDRMYEEHGKPVAKPPPGEPPRHLLQQAGLPASAPESAPGAEAEDLMPHRNPNKREPKSSCIGRAKLGPFNPAAKRIAWFNCGDDHTQLGDVYRVEVPRIDITGMRPYLPHLWFQQPGAVVTCDACDQEVPRNFGMTQGAPGASQFAQDAFVCLSCMGGAAF